MVGGSVMLITIMLCAIITGFFFLAIYEEDAQHLKQVFPHEWHDISVKCRVSCVTDVYNQVPEPYYLSVTEVFRYT